MTGNHVKVSSSSGLVACMDDLRAAVKATAMKTVAFAFGGEYLTYEQYKAIEQEAAVNLSSCMVAVTIVVFLMIVNPIASALVVFSVALGMFFTPPLRPCLKGAFDDRVNRGVNQLLDPRFPWGTEKPAE